MFRHGLLLVALFSQSLTVFAATASEARKLHRISRQAKQMVQSIERQCRPQLASFNAVDERILDFEIPAIDRRLFSAEEHFSDASEILDTDPSDFFGRRAFRRGCSSLARAALKLGTARIKSLDGLVFNPFADEFFDLKTDIEIARDEHCI